MYRCCSSFSCKENYIETRHPPGTRFCPECGAETDVQFELNDIINISKTKQARIIKKLSRHTDAGMSSVYLAERTNTNRARAVVKIAKKSKKTAVRALEREVDHLKNLKHPNIIRLAEGKQDVWQDQKDGQDLYFTALEYLSGGSLKDRLANRKPLPLSEAVAITASVGQALDYIHKQGVVHFDVKPANIMFDGNGRVVLSDFGVSRSQAELGKIRGRLGTLSYNAPEQFKHDVKADKRVDIYALGVTFYEMLLGECPIQVSRNEISSGDDAIRQSIEKLPLPTQRIPGLWPKIHKIILNATNKDRSRRYNRAGVFARDLLEAATGLPEYPRRDSHWLVAAMAAMAIALVIVGAAVAFVLIDDDEPPSVVPVPVEEQADLPADDASSVALGSQHVPPTAGRNVFDAPEDAPVSPTATLRPNQTPDPTATLAVWPTFTPDSSPKGTVKTTPSAPNPVVAENKLVIISPGNNFNITSDTVEFKWRYAGEETCTALPNNHFFELRIWPDVDGETPQGAMDAKADAFRITCDPASGIWSYTMGNIRHAHGVLDAVTVQRFRWDAALVKIAPLYEPIANSESRIINIPAQ